MQLHIPMRLIVRIFNILVALVLLVLAFGIYRYAWRPLAQTSGGVDMPIHSAAKVLRDELGVPHIEAGSIEDALFVQGYVTAQDRLWQMDALRRLAAGELSEVVGPGAIESDQDARRLRLKGVAEEHARSLGAQDRNLLVAYARGVNYFIRTHRDRLPIEFTLLGYDPRPWSIVDSILAGLQMHRSLTNTWRDELTKKGMLMKGDPRKVDFLFPTRAGNEVHPGSNAWVLGGKHTATGKPVLANDTHLEWSFPSSWYSVHLKAPGLNVIGFSLPGLPCVIIGHNENIAWGVTNLQFDVQDLYREQFDPASGRYLFAGKPEQARLERTTIRIKGTQPVETSIWVTRHGPIILSGGNEFYSLRWTAAEPGSWQFPLLEVNQAKNWADFRRALTRFTGPGQNWAFADTQGNIGYQASGQLPIRRKSRGDLPVEGSGDYEWEGFIPFDELPSSYNPAAGYVITANQNPFPPDFPYQVSGNFSSPYRSLQIETRLKSREGWKAQEQLGIETDVYSAFSHFLAQQVYAVWDKRGRGNPSLTAAAALLKDWDGQMRAGSPAALIVTLVYQQLRRAVADSAAAAQGLAYENQMAPVVIEQLLRTRPVGWFADFDQTVLRAFADAIEDGKKIQGGDPAKWDYGRYTEFTLSHPVVGRVPYVGGFFNLGPAPMNGSSTTVKQTSKRLGPSMRFIADLSNWDGSYHNITTGQSGQPLSGHFRDQWKSYYSGVSFSMPFQNISAKNVLEVNARPE